MATTRIALALRVSDAERERVADLLRECCGEGRIGLDELSGRLDRVYAARTGYDLAPVVADLPGGRGALPGAPPSTERSPARRRAVRAAWLAGLMLVAAVLLSAAAAAPLEAAIVVALLAVIVVLLVEALLAALPVLLVGWVVWRVARFVRARPELRLAPPR